MKRDPAYWETEAGKAEEAAIAAQRAREAREDEAVRRREEEARIAEIGIPPLHLDALRAGNIRPTDATVALTGPTKLTCLSGDTGVGKTLAAAAWLLAGPVEGSLFVSAAELARWERYDRAEMARLLGAPRLVIDDLGTEYQDAKGNFMAIFDELVNVRYTHRLPTVLTTNITDPIAFRRRYGDRVTGRIREVGRFVVLGGIDQRGAK